MLRVLSRLVNNSVRCGTHFKPNELFKFTHALSVKANFIRFKYINYGVQGRRNSKTKPLKYISDDDDVVEDEYGNGVSLQDG